jgi:D-lactate dehydrogenase
MFLYTLRMTKIALFQAEGWQAEYEKNALTDKGFTVDVITTSLDAAHLPVARDYDAVSMFVGSACTKEVIDAFPNLKVVTTRSTGFDHIDCAYAKEKNIPVGYVPYYGENTVAEFAIGLMLTLSRKLYWSVDRIKRADNFSFEGLEGFDIKGKTVGVIGTGHIGQHVIKMLKGFDATVIAYDAYPNEKNATELGFSYASLDDLLGRSDIVTIHVPYLPSTHHLINKDNIGKIKKGSYLVNTARGAIVETEALVLALKKEILAGAALDVLEEEGILKDEMGYWLKDIPGVDHSNMETDLFNHILMDMPNVIVTPHNAFNSREANTRILDTDIANLTAFFEKGSVVNGVPEAH